MTTALASFFTDIVDYFKENPLYFYILIGIVVLLIVVIAVIIIAKARKRRGLPFSETEEEPEAPAEDEQQPAPQDAPAQPAAQPVAEAPAEDAAAQGDAAQGDAAQPQTAAPQQESDAAEDGSGSAAPAKRPQRKPRVLTEEERARRQIIYSGKWVILQNANGTYRFELRASNGERLLGSNDYSSVQGAKSGIKTYKSNIEKDNIVIARSKGGSY